MQPPAKNPPVPDRSVPNGPVPNEPASSARPQARTTDERLSALFPDLADGPARRPRRGRAAVAALAVSALAIGAFGLSRAGAADEPTYRTATASIQDVDALLAAAATVEPVSQAAVAFPVAGTVASVDVEVGDEVVIGQLLATLDDESLAMTLRERQASLDQAELVLSRALAGEDVSAPLGGSSQGSAPTAGGSTSGEAAGAAASAGDTASAENATATSAPVVQFVASTQGGGSNDLHAAQEAVVEAQRVADAAMLAATDALASATSVCAALGTDVPTTTPTSVPPESVEPTSAGKSGSSAETGQDGDSQTACDTALRAVLTAQQAVSGAQQDVATAAAALDGQLAAAAAAAESQPGNGQAGTQSGAGLPGSGQAGADQSGIGQSGSGQPSGSDTITASTASAEQLIALQKAVDAAELEVAVAAQAMSQATIVSPMSGTVVSVGLEVRDDVTAASATQTVLIEGPGGYEASFLVGVADVADLEVGLSASLLPDGSDTPIDGEVVSVALSTDDSTSGSTYRVAVGLDGDTSALRNGATGTVSVTTGAATAALAVPTSAVTADGERHSVLVVGDGEAERVQVEVGVVGGVWTEILSGIEDGDAVVLAEVDAPLPGSATESDPSATGGVAGSGPAFPGSGSGPPAGMRPPGS